MVLSFLPLLTPWPWALGKWPCSVALDTNSAQVSDSLTVWFWGRQSSLLGSQSPHLQITSILECVPQEFMGWKLKPQIYLSKIFWNCRWETIRLNTEVMTSSWGWGPDDDISGFIRGGKDLDWHAWSVSGCEASLPMWCYNSQTLPTAWVLMLDLTISKAVN